MKPDSKGMALFLVLGILAAIGILAFSLHNFSRRQRFQSYQPTSGEIAYHAAEFGLKQCHILVQRGVEFLNSTSPATFPKKTTAPTALKPFVDHFVNIDGRLVDAPTSLVMAIPLVDSALLSELKGQLSLEVTLRLENQKPLFETSPIPGVLEPSSERRGRFVIDATADFRGTKRRVVAVFEQRTVMVTWPVLGRFVLTTSELEGELNPVTGGLTPGGPLKIPLPFPDSFSPSPLVVMGGPGIQTAQRSAAQANPADFLNRQGWICLNPPPSGNPQYWTFNLAPGIVQGEHFSIGEDRVYFFNITAGTDVLGRQVSLPGGGSFKLWETHQAYAFLTGLYKETKEAARQYFMEAEPGETAKSSVFRLFGITTLPSPTLVFGKAFRRYIRVQPPGARGNDNRRER